MKHYCVLCRCRIQRRGVIATIMTRGRSPRPGDRSSINRDWIPGIYCFERMFVPDLIEKRESTRNPPRIPVHRLLLPFVQHLLTPHEYHELRSCLAQK